MLQGPVRYSLEGVELVQVGIAKMLSQQFSSGEGLASSDSIPAITGCLSHKLGWQQVTVRDALALTKGLRLLKALQEEE